MTLSLITCGLAVQYVAADANAKSAEVIAARLPGLTTTSLTKAESTNEFVTPASSEIDKLTAFRNHLNSARAAIVGFKKCRPRSEVV